MTAIVFHIKTQRVTHIITATSKRSLYRKFKDWLKRYKFNESNFDYYIDA